MFFLSQSVFNLSLEFFKNLALLRERQQQRQRELDRQRARNKELLPEIATMKHIPREMKAQYFYRRTKQGYRICDTNVGLVLAEIDTRDGVL